MNKPTIKEIKELEAFERRHKNSYRFLRETPRDQREIPFAESDEDARNKRPSIGELVVWFILWGGFLGFLFFMLHLEQVAK
jgi:hypothetical protein